MKNLFIVLILLSIMPSCRQSHEDVKQYVAKISPVGESDIPHFTIFISETKVNLPKEEPFSIILTDEKTLSQVVSFIRNTATKKYSKKNTPTSGFNNYNISLYKNTTINMNYYLNGINTETFLNSLITTLVKSNSDKELIDRLNIELRRLKPRTY